MQNLKSRIFNEQHSLHFLTEHPCSVPYRDHSCIAQFRQQIRDPVQRHLAPFLRTHGHINLKVFLGLFLKPYFLNRHTAPAQLLFQLFLHFFRHAVQAVDILRRTVHDPCHLIQLLGHCQTVFDQLIVPDHILTHFRIFSIQKFKKPGAAQTVGNPVALRQVLALFIPLGKRLQNLQTLLSRQVAVLLPAPGSLRAALTQLFSLVFQYPVHLISGQMLFFSRHAVKSIRQRPERFRIPFHPHFLRMIVVNRDFPPAFSGF